MSDPTISIYTVTYTPALVDNSTLPTPKRFPWTSSPQSLADLYNQPITSLGNETLNNILKDPKYHDVKITNTNIRLTGTHAYDCSNGSKYALYITDESGVRTGGEIDTNPGGVESGTDVISINRNTFNDQEFQSYELTLDLSSTISTCVTYPYINMTLTFTVTVQVGLCTSTSTTLTSAFLNAAISNPTCVMYCQSPEGLPDVGCLNVYDKYCLTPVTPGLDSTMRIGSDTNCQEYFLNYVQNVKPISTLDNALEKYCTKYKGLEDVYNLGEIDSSGNTTSPIEDYFLCGCNMPQQQYITFGNDLMKAFPDVNFTSVQPECFYPPCVASSYGTVRRGKKCAVSQCLNIIGITNNGTFDRSTININESAKCKKILGEKSSGTGTDPQGNTPNGQLPPDDKRIRPPGTEQSFWDKYKVWIIIGIAVVVVIIIIIIIVIASSGGGSDDGDDNTSKTNEQLLLSSL